MIWDTHAIVTRKKKICYRLCSTVHPKAKRSPCRQQIPRRTLADGITVEAICCVCFGDKLLELGHVLGAVTFSGSELAPRLVRVFFSGCLFFCLWA